MDEAMTTTNGLAVRQESMTAYSAREVRQNVNLIQEVMQSVMQKDVHYGTVPGCGPKPTLLKAGAEKLLVTFRIAADPVVEDLSSDDERRYRVTTRGIHIQTGAFVGAGVGECSTSEDKYGWRASVSDAEYNATEETRRRIKYTRNGEVKQVRTNPADLANTVLKMAKKRSLVDLALSATAASDIFTQDIEEMDVEHGVTKEAYPRKAVMQNATQLKGGGFTVSKVDIKTGTGQKGPWTLYKVFTNDGIYSTFNAEMGGFAQSVAGTGQEVLIEWRAGRRDGDKDILSIEPIASHGEEHKDAPANDSEPWF